MQLRSITYDLERRDIASAITTTGGRSWREWTRTAGAVLRLPEFDFHYRLRITTGVGRPEAAPFFGWATSQVFAPGPIPGPAPQTLLPVRVLTQQLSVSVPIR
jgi:hypothetical protein